MTPRVGPVQHTLGFRLATVGEHVCNPMMGVHGGVVCTLLDSAMGCAVMSLCDAKTGYTTVDLDVHLTRPITVKTGAFVAEGKIVHRGSRVMTVEGRLVDAQGKLLAHATATCMLLDRRVSDVPVSARIAVAHRAIR